MKADLGFRRESRGTPVWMHTSCGGGGVPKSQSEPAEGPHASICACEESALNTVILCSEDLLLLLRCGGSCWAQTPPSRSALSLRGRGLLTMVMARQPAPPVFKCMPVAVLALLLGCPHQFGERADHYGTCVLTLACWHACPGGHSWLEGTRDLKHVGPSDWWTSGDGLCAVCSHM